MATAGIYFDIRRPLASGLYPVRIRVIHELKTKFYATKYSFPKQSESDKKKGKLSEFDRVMSGKYLTDNVEVDTLKNLRFLEAKAVSIIDSLEFFSFDVFEKKFFNTGDKSDLIYLLKAKSDKFKANEQFASANLYKQAAEALNKYLLNTKGKTKEQDQEPEMLPLKALTPDLLKDFQKWALKNNYSITTISMYLVRVKAIVNASDLVKNSPFGPADKGKYQIPKSKNTKRPLLQAEIMLLYNYESDNKNEIFARDIFIFSYLSNGMNLTDIFKLRWANITGNEFTFVRQKTMAKQPDKEIAVLINEDINQIIERHGVKNIDKNAYIFNVLSAGLSAESEHKKIRTTISTINATLKRIAGKLGITSDISSYYARHSFATILRDSDVPLSYISQQLGHSGLAITQAYLDRYKTDKVEEYQNKLLKKAN